MWMDLRFMGNHLYLAPEVLCQRHQEGIPGSTCRCRWHSILLGIPSHSHSVYQIYGLGKVWKEHLEGERDMFRAVLSVSGVLCLMLVGAKR